VSVVIRITVAIGCNATADTWLLKHETWLYSDHYSTYWPRTVLQFTESGRISVTE